MTLLKIARMGHPILARRALEVDDPTSREVRQLVRDMIETMDDARGTGLAAPQVHVGRRVVAFKVKRGRAVEEVGPEGEGEGEGEGEDEGEDEGAEKVPLTVLINPELEPLGEEMELGWEGCLSVPGLTGLVPRYRSVRYRGVTPTGEIVEREASDFHARVVQHEFDHLDGILYPMRMTDLRLLCFNEELHHFMAAEGPEAAAEAEL